MARRYSASIGDAYIEFEFKDRWFRDVCGQSGVHSLMGSESARVAETATARMPGERKLDKPAFSSAVDVNAGWPHGRAWASNPYSINYENKYKILGGCL